MEGAEEATIHPDGSASYEEPLLNETFEGNNETNFEDGGLPENDAVPSIDPAFYLILGVAVLLGLYFYFVLRKKVQEGEDEFFSNLDGDKFNLKLPAEVDEYYKVKARCEQAGWEPGSTAGKGAVAAGHQKVMAQALMKRAMADLPLVMHIQKESAGMTKLYSKSMCSVKQWRSYQAAEQLVSNEVNEVKMEADEIDPGWSEAVWRQATHYHNMLKKKHEMDAQAAQEKARSLENQTKPKPIEEAKDKELEAQRLAEELIKEEEKQDKQQKKAFKGMKKGYLEKSKKK